MTKASATLEASSTDAMPVSSSDSRRSRSRSKFRSVSPRKAIGSKAVGEQTDAANSPAEYLDAIGPRGRLDAYRSGALSRRERTIWACRYPEEVPILNGEVEWIALAMADLA